jgi:PAS domain S-box-containing protein
MLVTLFPGTVYSQSRTVHVGVYQNKPKVYTDENGEAAGIFIELLDEVAAQEGWTLVYVPCEWADCLRALEDGKIDLMPDVAYSPERDANYDFHKIPVLESWSRVYASSGAPINKFSELDGKRVALLKDSIQQTTFEQMMSGFGYDMTVVPADSLEQAFALVSDGSADAAIANHHFGDYFYQEYGLVKATIVFNPVTLYYATAEGRNHDLLEAIDGHLGRWLQEPNSPYYTTLGRWTEKEPAGHVPAFILWIIGGITGLLVAAAGMILLLRQQVKVRTRHLEQASEELRESEERYQTLARISPVGIFQTDSNGATTYINPKWCEISGLTFNQALGDGWLSAVHPDDRERLSKGWQDAIQLHKASRSDYRFVRPDGTIVWVIGQAVPEMNPENQIVGYVGTITDITDRKRAEAALQASERQLSLIYANISDILFYLAVEPDDHFRFISINPAFLEATGLTEDQVAGKLVQDVIPEPTLSMVQENYKEAIRLKKSVGWQEVTVYPAGENHGEVSIIPILDGDGNCTHLIGTVHDISERVRAETQLRRLNTELEERVARRTEELKAAMHRAQEADRLKSAFLATMSHELRTPLNSIIGFTGVLLQGLAGPLNAEQTKQLGMTRDSARHLLALINDVLDISKIEAGQLEVACAPFEMRAAIEDTLRLVSPQAQKKAVTLSVAIASNVGAVVSDRRRVEQILLNLLSNAIKFTEKGEVQLECRTRDGWLETSVRDSGIGIRPEDLGKLFEPFHQLETGLNRRHEGTGLGLAICKNLVNLLGGQIRAESEWGAGSTFTFTLPLAPEGEPCG